MKLKALFSMFRLASPPIGRSIIWSFLFLIFFLSSCKGDLSRLKLITSRANVNIEKGKDVEIDYSDKGVVRIKATAPTATRFNREKPYLEFSDGIKILFYNDAHEVESTLTAKYATAYENSHAMTARDSVVVINNKGEILNTDELIWDEDKKIIYSNSFVKITTTDEIIYGNGMTANENFTDYVIKHITGTIKVKTSQL
jgi:LPS export ABC transporter protein LptC